jgi:hypothetical protein
MPCGDRGPALRIRRGRNCHNFVGNKMSSANLSVVSVQLPLASRRSESQPAPIVVDRGGITRQALAKQFAAGRSDPVTAATVRFAGSPRHSRQRDPDASSGGCLGSLVRGDSCYGVGFNVPSHEPINAPVYGDRDQSAARAARTMLNRLGSTYYLASAGYCVVSQKSARHVHRVAAQPGSRSANPCILAATKKKA